MVMKQSSQMQKLLPVTTTVGLFSACFSMMTALEAKGAIMFTGDPMLSGPPQIIGGQFLTSDPGDPGPDPDNPDIVAKKPRITVAGKLDFLPNAANAIISYMATRPFAVTNEAIIATDSIFIDGDFSSDNRQGPTLDNFKGKTEVVGVGASVVETPDLAMSLGLPITPAKLNYNSGPISSNPFGLPIGNYTLKQTVTLNFGNLQTGDIIRVDLPTVSDISAAVPEPSSILGLLTISGIALGASKKKQG